MVRVSRSRSQDKNKKLAVRELKINYAIQKRHPVDPEKFKLPSSLRSYVEDNLRIKRKNPHFPFLVKLVLDLFDHCQARLGETGDVLGASTNALVNFFQRDKTLWAKVNSLREKHGHDRLTT